MAEVTVKELAQIVGAPVDRLLKHMGEAGLGQTSADDVIANEEKKELLAFLKRSHGESDATPKKITLNRKVTTQLKTSGSQGRNAKTVNVEVRKKRTYVKRSSVENQASAEKLEEELARQAVEEARLAEEALIAANEAAKKQQAPAEQGQKDAQASPEIKAAVDGKEDVSTAAGKSKEAPEADEPLKVKELSEHERFKLEKEEREKLKAHNKGKKAAKPKAEKEWIQEVFEEDLPLEEGNRPTFKRKKAVFTGAKLAKPTKFLQKHAFAKPKAPVLKEIAIPESIVVSELAQRMSVKAVSLIRSLMKMGVMSNINQSIDRDTAILLVEEFGHTYKLEEPQTFEQTVVMLH